MRLYLMRHASAEESADPGNPADPGLSREGTAKARAAAQGLAALGIKPDKLLTSPLLRAAQTAEIVSRELGNLDGLLRPTDALQPGSDPTQLLEELSRLEAKEMICFGHAPHLDDVIARLIGSRTRATALKKAAVACLEIESTAVNRGILLWLYPQKTLRRLGK